MLRCGTSYSIGPAKTHDDDLAVASNVSALLADGADDVLLSYRRRLAILCQVKVTLDL